MTLYRAVVSGELYGTEKWANVFHLQLFGAPDFSGLGAAFVKFYVSGSAQHNVLHHCAGSVAGPTIGVHLSQFSLQAVTSPGIPLVAALDSKGEQNALGGMPVDTCIVVSWRTALAGRSFRGRTYLPPFHSIFMKDGAGLMPSLDPVAQNNLAAASATLLADLRALDSPLVVYSRKSGNSTEVTGGYIDNEWDTQRRRSKSQPKTRVVFSGP